MHGDFGIPEVNRFTAALLAQNGFVTLAIKRLKARPN
jgi:hypothetical protein